MEVVTIPIELVTVGRERVTISFPLKPCLQADHLGVFGTVKEQR